MSRNLIWKFALIVFITVLMIWEVYPPKKRLKPGIDLAGGTSLLYQIDTTGLTDVEKREIAQDMIRVLRQRIDPDNTRNLVWRAHGNDRMEIQMPLATAETRELRERYQELRDQLSEYNLDLRRIRQALVKPAEMDQVEYEQWRQEQFRQLAAGDEVRLELLEALGEAYDAQRGSQEVLEAALEARQAAEAALEKAGVSQASVLGLYGRWGELDDPNRTVELERLGGGEQTAVEAIRLYIEARQAVEQGRGYFDQAGAQGLFDQAWQALEAENFDIDKFEQVVSSRERTGQLTRMKEQYPELAETIDRAVAAYDAYAQVAGRLDNPEDLKRLLRGSGVLEFRIAPMPGEMGGGEVERYIEALQEYGPTKAGDERYVWRPIRDPEEFREDLVRATFAGEEYVLLSNQMGEVLLHETGETGWRLQDARVGNDQYGKWAVDFKMNKLGASRFFELTGANKQRPLTILLDDDAISVPNIQSEIYDRGQITGQFTLQEVQDLVDKLNAGSLPARLSDQPISENTVGPTLGRDNLEAGLKAGVYGLMAVAAFMLVYYWFAGVLANVALFMNLLLITGIMALLRATFTMPGIAGLILTIGMAVDANVLVYERIREEQARGSSLRMAIKNGYGRALRTILDANITTFITALILYLLASEEVKGFALILMIGIASSMFTALFVTRAIFDLFTGTRILKDRLRMSQWIGRPSVNWMGKKPVFFMISGLLVVGGWATFLSRDEQKNSKYSIEFTGGTSVHVLLDADRAAELLTAEEAQAGVVLREKVEDLVQAQGREAGNPALASARVQRIGREREDQLEFEIVTTETNRIEARLVGGGEGITAEGLQSRLREVAKRMGDGRLGQSEVRAGDEGTWILETPQTNTNRVNEAIEIVLRELSRVELASVDGEDDEAAAVIRARQGESVTIDQVRQALDEAMSEMHVMGVGVPQVEAGAEDGAFVMRAEGSVNALRQVAAATVANLAPLQLEPGSMVTLEVVTDAIRNALEGYLEELESLDPQVVQSQPITDELIAQKPYLSSYRGGLFLSAEFGQGQQETLARLQERFQRAKFRGGFERYGNYDRVVFAPGDRTEDPQASLEAMELAVYADSVVYGASSEQEWTQFVQAERERLGETLAWETSLPRVTQIDPSVGDRARNDAMVAIVFSLLAIIGYIWLRFGNVRFGLAAVAALVHDVSIALGLVVASAWLAQTSIGRALGIADFKIDLTMIAGILTVIGYSLNDTIVVFDRIRENRGKLAVLSADVINNSINQTLSRTVLTSLTTLLVLVVMYIWGGPGLRGFNYVLIIGVVVGTYSSIAIASPLLIGARTEAAPLAGPAVPSTKPVRA